MKNTLLILLVVCLTLVYARHHGHKNKHDKNDTGACKHSERTLFEGCIIENGQCVCGEEKACKNPFVYKSEHQCLKDLKGEYDKCRNHPCENGQCVQAKENDTRRWVCSCAGSGFHGKRCQHECPPMPADRDQLPEDFPVDCIY